MSPKSVPKTAIVAALALCMASCRAQREILIYSDPPGADIRLDGTLLPQKTPARIAFKDYGVRRVTLYLDGYRTYSESFHIKPPWYGYFPLDLVSEILIPVGWHDRHRLRVTMSKGDERAKTPDLVEVLERAESMRRAGPAGAKVHKEPARTLPRETSGVTAPAPDPEPPAPAPSPVKPPAGGGGG